MNYTGMYEKYDRWENSPHRFFYIVAAVNSSQGAFRLPAVSNLARRQQLSDAWLAALPGVSGLADAREGLKVHHQFPRRLGTERCCAETE